MSAAILAKIANLQIARVAGEPPAIRSNSIELTFPDNLIAKRTTKYYSA